MAKKKTTKKKAAKRRSVELWISPGTRTEGDADYAIGLTEKAVRDRIAWWQSFSDGAKSFDLPTESRDQSASLCEGAVLTMLGGPLPRGLTKLRVSW